MEGNLLVACGLPARAGRGDRSARVLITPEDSRAIFDNHSRPVPRTNFVRYRSAQSLQFRRSLWVVQVIIRLGSPAFPRQTLLRSASFYDPPRPLPLPLQCHYRLLTQLWFWQQKHGRWLLQLWERVRNWGWTCNLCRQPRPRSLPLSGRSGRPRGSSVSSGACAALTSSAECCLINPWKAAPLYKSTRLLITLISLKDFPFTSCSSVNHLMCSTMLRTEKTM